MWFSVVCTLIDNDACHHSGQNLLRTHEAAPCESSTFWPLWWCVSLLIRVQTTLNHIQFVKLLILEYNVLSWKQKNISLLYSFRATINITLPLNLATYCSFLQIILKCFFLVNFSCAGNKFNFLWESVIEN